MRDERAPAHHRPGLVGACGHPGMGLLAYRRTYRGLPAVLRLAARGPALRALRPGHRDRREGRLAGRGARVRRHRRAGPGLDGADLPRARPRVPPGRDGRPGGLRRDGLPRGPAARQRHRPGLRPQPRPAPRRVPPRAGPDLPAGCRRPGRIRPLDRAALGRGPHRAPRPPAAAELAPPPRPPDPPPAPYPRPPRWVEPRPPPPPPTPPP